MSTDELGPLPEADKYSINQRKSLVALNNLLPKDQFIFRDERADDYGIDGSLELIVGDRVTNLRSNVQLKSIDSENEKLDGSISVSVDTSNLNYVLNGASPLYILYVVPTKQLRFAWASDERIRIEVKKPHWQGQGSVTLRFADVLDPTALTAIFDRVKREGMGLRAIKDRMASAGLGETITVEIREESFKAVSPEETFDFITANGIDSVAMGFSPQVIEKIGLLQGDSFKHPKIQLIRAYAHFSISKHYDCLGAIAEATRRESELSPSEINLLRIVQAASRFYIGKLDQPQFEERLLELEEDGSLMQLQNRLESLKLETVSERNDQRKAELMAQMESTANEIKSHAECTTANALLADISLLYVSGMKASKDFADALGNIQILHACKMPVSDAEVQTARQALTDWTTGAIAILKRASELQHPMLIGDAASTFITVELSVLSTDYLNSIQSGDNFAIAEDHFRSLVAHAEDAIEVYSMSDNVEGELRCKMLLANLYELNGNGDKAQEIATLVNPTAEAFEFHKIASQSAAYIQGASFLQQTAKAIGE